MTGVRIWVLLALLMAGLAAAMAQNAPAPAGLSTLSFQGLERKYFHHRPPGATGAVPLVIGLHGLNQTVEGIRQTWTMDAIAEREGFAVLYPAGVGGRWSYDESRPVKLPGNGGLVDDVGFLNAILDKLVDEGSVDALRIYAAGISNGGLMAWTMACRMSERLAGVAPMLSGMLESQAEQCRPSRLVPLVVLAGTSDWLQPYDGAITEQFRLLSIPESLEFWRRPRGCTDYEVDMRDPHAAADPTRAVVINWMQCKVESPMRFYRIEGGGHALPTFAPANEKRRPHGGSFSQTIETAEELWTFFKAQRLQPSVPSIHRISHQPGSDGR
jgi:polyhydroxybutyrate depolymerase